MNEVSMMDVKSYLDGEIKPGFLNFLEKRKVKKIEELMSNKINFILNSQVYLDQLPDHPCSDSMFPVFRDKFLKGQLTDSSAWFRVLSSPGILQNFSEITPDILSYVPDEILSDDTFLLRFYKYNTNFMLNVIRTTFQSYDQILTYSYTGNDLNSLWFYQNITNQICVNAFAPNFVDEKGKANFKTKQLDPIQLWSLNSEIYLSKIKSVQVTPKMFNLREETLSINVTPSQPYNQNVDRTTFQSFNPQLIVGDFKGVKTSSEIEDPTNPSQMQVDYIDSNQIEDISNSESVRKFNCSIIDQRIIGKKAEYFDGERVIKVKIQNLSFNFEQIYLQVLEDTYPGSEILIIDVSSISYKLSEDQAWLNPEVLKIIA